MIASIIYILYTILTSIFKSSNFLKKIPKNFTKITFNYIYVKLTFIKRKDIEYDFKYCVTESES